MNTSRLRVPYYHAPRSSRLCSSHLCPSPPAKQQSIHSTSAQHPTFPTAGLAPGTLVPSSLAPVASSNLLPGEAAKAAETVILKRSYIFQQDAHQKVLEMLEQTKKFVAPRAMSAHDAKNFSEVPTPSRLSRTTSPKTTSRCLFGSKNPCKALLPPLHATAFSFPALRGPVFPLLASVAMDYHAVQP